MLVQGQKIEAIVWSDGSCTVGENGCSEITISMENGQMAGVPWAHVKNENGTEQLYNLAQAEGIKIK